MVSYLFVKMKNKRQIFINLFNFIFIDHSFAAFFFYFEKCQFVYKFFYEKTFSLYFSIKNYLVFEKICLHFHEIPN